MVPESVDSKKAVQRDAENINSISYDPIRETRGQGTAPEFPEQALKAGDESKRADPALEAVLRGEAIDCIGPSGTAVLMNTGSAHAGTARHTDRQRRTIHVYYGRTGRRCRCTLPSLRGCWWARTRRRSGSSRGRAPQNERGHATLCACQCVFTINLVRTLR